MRGHEGTAEQIKTAAELMELLDRKWEEAGDLCLGSTLERLLVEAHLRAIETDILEDPGALESMLVRANWRYNRRSPRDETNGQLQ